MFEECFSMIELTGLVERTPKSAPKAEDDGLFQYLSGVVLAALEEALFSQEDVPTSLH